MDRWADWPQSLGLWALVFSIEIQHQLSVLSDVYKILSSLYICVVFSSAQVDLSVSGVFSLFFVSVMALPKFFFWQRKPLLFSVLLYKRSPDATFLIWEGNHCGFSIRDPSLVAFPKWKLLNSLLVMNKIIYVGSLTTCELVSHFHYDLTKLLS